MTAHIRKLQSGFTLVEMVIVIVITGIVAGIVAVFIRTPVAGYLSTTRRAELTDIADTALRRVARDIQNALPNSVRSTGTFLEFVPIKAAGRYRADYDVGGAGNPLTEFGVAPSSSNFDVYGPPLTLAAGDWIVIYNLGIAGSNVYDGSSRRAATSIGSGLTTIGFGGATSFPFPSPSSRFQVVNINSTVSYVCVPDTVDTVNASSGFLYRYTGYAIPAAQPTSLATLNGLAGVTSAILASHVSACSLTYTTGALQSQGLVSISLQVTEGSDTVRLQHEVNVNNTP
jgi:MSHA biogenesis protein MshO